MNIKSKLKAIEKKHARGFNICDSALSDAEEIFKNIEDYHHCQTSKDGSIEVIIGAYDREYNILPADHSMYEALELLEGE